MKWFQRLISCCLVLCMLLGQFPVLAAAEETTGGWGTPGNLFEKSGTASIYDQVPSFGGTSIFATARSGGAITALTVGGVDALANPQGEGYSFDAETATLTLNGFRYENHEDTFGIHCTGDLTILLYGENYIDVSVSEYGNSSGVYVIGALTIQGDPNGADSLTVIADNQLAAILGETLSIENCDSIAAAATAQGVCGNSQLNIFNSSVTANTAPFEKYCELGMLDLFPAVGSMGPVSIHASTIQVEAGLQGIYGQNTEIVGGSTVSSLAEVFPIMCANNLSIVDSQVDVLNTTTEDKFGKIFEVTGVPVVSAIYLNGSTIDDILLIQNSRVTAKALYIATMSMNTAIVEGSTVTIEGGYAGIYSEYNTFVENSTVTASNTFSLQKSIDYCNAVQLNVPPAGMFVFDGNGAIQINSSNVTVPQGYFGAAASNVVAANSSLDIRNCFAAVYANTAAEIRDCSSVYLESSREVADEYLTASGQDGYPVAIYTANGPISIENCPDVTLSGVMAAVCANVDNVNISNSHVVSDGGILAWKNLSITDSKVQANVEQTKEDVMLGCVPIALDGEASIHVTHSEVVAIGCIAGLWNGGGVIEIKDSTVEASASWTAEETAEMELIGPAAIASASGRIVLWDSVTTNGETVGQYSWLNTECTTFLASSGVPQVSVSIVPEKVISGVCGENLTWTFEKATGILTISGEGDMYDFDYVDIPWKDVRPQILHVILSEGVTGIGTHAFEECHNLADVVLPEGLLRIADYAFQYCSSLTAVNIPASVTSIGGAFVACNSLERICVAEENAMYSSDAYGILFNKDKTELIYAPEMLFGDYSVPDSVTRIYNIAFALCSKVTRIALPAGLTEIGEQAFLACIGLRSFTVADENNHFSCDANGVLYNKDKTQLICIPSLVSVENGTYVIPDTVTGMVDCAGSFAQVGCIVIPNGISEVPEMAFLGSTIQAVTIPASVEKIGVDAFGGCSELTYVFFGGTEEQWNDIIIEINNEYLLNAQVVFEDNMDGILASGTCGENVRWKLDEAGKLTVFGEGAICDDPFWLSYRENILEVVIEDGVTAIGKSAFADCMNLVSVSIPESVEIIEQSAFSQCVSLPSITIPASVTYINPCAFSACFELDGIWVEADNSAYSNDEYGVLFNKEKTELLRAPGGLSGEYSVPSSVTKIRDEAFLKCINIAVVSIPEGVETIGRMAFYWCNSLEKIIFEGSAPTTFHENAFCEVTTTAYYPANNPTWTESVRQNYGGNLTWIAYETDEPICGTCGDNLTWTLDSNGLLTISGEGDMYDFSSAVNPWQNLRNQIRSVVLKPGITNVGSHAFIGCENLTEVTIPDGVISIGNGAFANCWSLDLVVLPESVITIGNDAFDYCQQLKGILIPEGVVSIGDCAFLECDNLQGVEIPASVNHIGDGAFLMCDDLEGIFVSADNAVYSSDNFGVLFNKDKTELLMAPGGLFGDYVIPNSVEIIQDAAFICCNNVSSITIPSSVSNIGYQAFVACLGLTSFTVSGENQYYCSDAYGIIYDKQKTALIAVPTLANADNGNFVIPDTVRTIAEYACLNIVLKSITIPKGVTEIPTGAFNSCISLESVTIPASVKTIAEQAFQECISLADVYFCGTEEQWHDITIGSWNEYLTNANIHFEEEGPEIIASGTCGENVNWKLDSDGLLIVSGTGRMEEAIISNETRKLVKNVIVEEGITEIGNGAFSYFEETQSISLPDSVTVIDKEAFGYCLSLESLNISENVTTIHASDAFELCRKLTGIWVDENNPYFSSDDSGVLYNKEKTQLLRAPESLAGEYVIPEGVTVIGDKAFINCEKLTQITISESVTEIGVDAFNYSRSLTEIYFVGSAPKIAVARPPFFNVTATAYYPANDATWTEEDRQKYGGTITWVAYEPEVPEQPEIIASGTCGENAQWKLDENGLLTISGEGETYDWNSGIVPWKTYVDQILSVSVSRGVTRIGNRAFEGCDNLTTVNLAESVTGIGKSAFVACKNLSSVMLPDSLTEIGRSAFSGCENLTSITIPSGMSSIGDWVFSSSGLTAIDLPNNITSIGEGAFAVCPNMMMVNIPDSIYSIGAQAFWNCDNLTSVTIPESVTNIGDGAFATCGNLERIIVDVNNAVYASDDMGLLYTKDYATLLCYPAGIEYCSIPETVTHIAGSAFEGCTNLSAITLPAGITDIGAEAFKACFGLETITIPEGVRTISNSMFTDCWNLNSITLPDSVTKIEKNAFDHCRSLSAITIPCNVVSIENEVFSGCSVLQTIDFKGNAPTIGDDAFYGVTATCYYPEDNDNWTDADMQDYGGTLTWVRSGGPVDELELEIMIPGAQNAGIEIVAPEGGWKTGGNTFTVSCDAPCVVAVSYDNGATFIRLDAAAGSGGYSFTADNMTAETIIAVSLCGDANGDGKVTNADITRLAAVYSGKTTIDAVAQLAADVNKSGDITNADITRLSAVYAEKTTLSW